MSASSESPEVFVLNIEVVKWAMDALARQRIHSFFLAYLHLRKWAIEQEGDFGIRTDWEEIPRHLRVPGGPPGRPFYRPMWERAHTPSHYWLNPNIPGSYSPKSVRGERPHQVVDISRSEYSLLPDHAHRAFTFLLYEDRISAVAFAAYYYRDFGIIIEKWNSPVDILAGVFARHFHFADDNQDFDTLFTLDAPSFDFDAWFEPLPGEMQGFL